MNYFEFYEIPESFAVDAAALKKKFYELSKKYHPDFYATEDEAKQQQILELSTLNNKAFQVLGDQARRTEYILKQHDLLKEGEKYELSPAFLMEMMELNEALTEAEDTQQLANIKTQIDDFENDLNSEFARHTANYQTDDATIKQKELLAIKDIYFRQKYLLRIKDSLNTFAARL
ncbi:Fe-S protein assembly co-chaperone HscB [Mucilaginibacter sp. PPCGB 2223]|uniref:Fe-S protein assembly co-chaperone HscB n=1 Tax=Mucilaginibacter sp. PPCGB 2223 TaxID=1886027 RepID=UPI000824CA69|nr:Fe-S protein assembly co-chaperone HscB [Mucilaginibacter sp. PPCGB 2223]OCX52567.1 Fe-S protein assembly co-chaperone HscB [Mucilaginibacter sp. PPCGB 2223]